MLNLCRTETRNGVDTVSHCPILPHCGFRSCLAAPVETLQPGLDPCWAAAAEPRYPLRGGTTVGFRNGTPTPGLTLTQYCSKQSAKARHIQAVGTGQRPRLEQPNLPSWEPCRGHHNQRLGVGSLATGIDVSRSFRFDTGILPVFKGAVSVCEQTVVVLRAWTLFHFRPESNERR